MNATTRQAIVRINVGNSRGTGFVVGERLVLTAFHVVAKRQGEPELLPGEIELTLNGKTVRATADLELGDTRDDWILLRTEEPLGVTPLRLASVREEDVKWEAYGFPNAKPDGMQVSGEIEDPRGILQGVRALQLYSKQAAAGNGAPVPGLSGSAVIVEERVVGIMRFALMQQGQAVAGTLYACPIEALREKASHLLSLPEPSESEPALDGEQPYRGLEAFELEHSRLYFGREKIVEGLVRKVSASLEAAGADRFIAIVGASGSGKSSLARAGLAGAIRNGEIPGGENWPYAPLKPGGDPLESLALAVAGISGGQLDVDRLRDLKGKLAQDQQRLADELRVAMSDRPESERVILLVDQFEETFLSPIDEASKAAFVGNLVEAARAPNGRAVVIVTMRADFYARCARYRELAEAMSAQQALVGPMGTEELRRAIEAPAEAAGWELEPGLVSALLADVREQEEALPLLQYALLELWQRRSGRRMTHRAYEDIGGVAGAIERQAERFFERRSEQEQDVCRRILLQLVQPAGRRYVRRRANHDELTQGDQGELAEKLIHLMAGPSARLLVIQAEGQSTTVDLAHESILTSWKRLRRWLNDDLEFQLWRQRLRDARQQWVEASHHPDLLQPEARITEARRWLEARPADLAAEELEYINASIDFRELLAAEEEKRRQQMEEAKERTRAAERARKRLWKRAAIALGAASALLVAVAVYAHQRRIEANQRLADFRSSVFAAKAREAVEAQDAKKAIVYAAYALEESETRQAQEEFHRAVQADRSPLVEYYSDSIVSLDVDSAEERIATGSADGFAWVWGRNSDRYEMAEKALVDLTLIPSDPEGPQPQVTAVRFSEDDRWLATGDSKGFVRVLDIASSALVFESEQGEQEVAELAFSADGARLAEASSDGTLRLWNTGDWSGRRWKGAGSQAGGLTFGAGPDQLLSGTRNGVIAVWELTAAVSTPGPTLNDAAKEGLIDIAFDSVHGRLAACGADGGLWLWGPEFGPARFVAEAHSMACAAIEFSPDGSLLATVGKDRAAIVWSVDSLSPLTRLMGDPQVELNDVVFLPDSRHIAVADENGTVRLFEVELADAKKVAADLLEKPAVDLTDAECQEIDGSCAPIAWLPYRRSPAP